MYTKQYRRRSSQTIGRGQTKRNTFVYTYTQHTKVAAATAAVAERKRARVRALMLKNILKTKLNLESFLVLGVLFWNLHPMYTVQWQCGNCSRSSSLFSLFILWVRACMLTRVCVCMCGRPTIVGIWWAVYHFVSVRPWWRVCICVRVCAMEISRNNHGRKRRIGYGNGDDGNNNTKTGECLYVHVMAGW